MRRTTLFLASVAALALPSSALALDLTSPGGFLFDILETSTGALTDGQSDAYDTMYQLRVDGTLYDVRSASATTSLDGRQVEMAEIAMGSLMVRRLIYVPSGRAGMNYARFLELLRNPTDAPLTATVTIDGELGSNYFTVITGSATGDTTLSLEDNWLTTDDSRDGGGDPSLGHVLQGADGAVRADAVGLRDRDELSWSFTVTVPAGETIGLLTFAVQEANRARSIAESNRLAQLPEDALLGLHPYAAQIVNFRLGGAPFVRFITPREVDEGSEISVRVTVEDLEMDPNVSWSWDLDDDGAFGELAGELSYTVPPGTTDGDGELRVGLRTSDGVHTREIYRSIYIHNVPPAITGTPPTDAHPRREYRYEASVEDPGGALDPIRYVLIERPPGMLVDPVSGTLLWTPTIRQRGMTFDVALRVEDRDGGEDTQMWRIAVADNTPPEPPIPVSPIEQASVPEGGPVTLVAENGSDADDDRLYYFFRVSPTSHFEGAEVFGSGELDEDPSGRTSWTLTDELSPGLWYWDVWVEDGIIESHHRYGLMVVGDVSVRAPDAGPRGDGGTSVGDRRPPTASGCSAAPRDPVLPRLWPLGLAALALLRRRR